MKTEEVTIKFRIDADLTDKQKERIVNDIMWEIQDRFMVVTKAQIENKVIFAFDETQFLNGGTKE